MITLTRMYTSIHMGEEKIEQSLYLMLGIDQIILHFSIVCSVEMQTPRLRKRKKTNNPFQIKNFSLEFFSLEFCSFDNVQIVNKEYRWKLRNIKAAGKSFNFT